MKKLLLLLLVPTFASAESVNVQIFRSPLNLNYGMVESALNDSLPWEQPKDPHRIFVSLNYNYAKDPLVQINTVTNDRVKTLVESIQTTELTAGYFLQPDLSLYLQAPIEVVQVPNQGKKTDLGDTRIAAKWQLTDYDAPIALSLVPELVAPSGKHGYYVSDSSWSPGLLLAVEKNFGGFRLTGNLGYRYAQNAHIPEINYHNRIPLGVGAAVPLAAKWIFNAELSGFLALPVTQQQSPSELYLGINHQPRKDLALLLGGSVGAFDKQGSLNYRIMAALRLYLGTQEAEHKAVRPNIAPVAVAAPAPKARLVKDRIEIAEEINFENNKDILMPASKIILDEVADIILKHQTEISLVLVEGHTSLVGGAAHNEKLSQRRANAVVRYLSETGHVPSSLLVAKGYGMRRPKFLPRTATKAELERNRRVEFKLTLKH